MSLLRCDGDNCRLMPMIWQNGKGLCDRCASKAGWIVLASKSENMRERAVSLAARLQALREEFPYALLHAEQQPVAYEADAHIESPRVIENEFQNMQQAEMWYVNGKPSEYPF